MGDETAWTPGEPPPTPGPRGAHPWGSPSGVEVPRQRAPQGQALYGPGDRAPEAFPSERRRRVAARAVVVTVAVLGVALLVLGVVVGISLASRVG